MEDKKLKILKAVKDKTIGVDEAIKLLMQHTENKNDISSQQLAKELRQLLMQVLQLEDAQLTIETPFIEVGFDSISATEFANRINKTYQLNILPTLFFEFRNLLLLSEHLANYHLTSKSNNQEPMVSDSDKKIKKSIPIINTDQSLSLEQLWAKAEAIVKLEETSEVISKEEELPITTINLSQAHRPNTEVAIIGHGNPIILLGGLLQPYQAWSQQIKSLYQHHQLIMINPPGCGNSQININEFNMDTLCEQIQTVIIQLNLKKPLPILGYSLGGLIAMHFCLAHPQWISALILTCTTANTNAIHDGFMKLSHELLNSKQYDYIKQTNMNLLPIYGKALSHIDISAELKNIHVPTVIIAGEKDQYMLPEYALNIKNQIPHASYHLLAHAKHDLPFSHYQEFNQIIKEFLKHNKKQLWPSPTEVHINE